LYILGRFEQKYKDSPNLLRYYADVYLLKGEFDTAKAYYLQLKQLDPENEELINLLKRLK